MRPFRLAAVVLIVAGAPLVAGCQSPAGERGTARLDVDSLRRVFARGLERHRAMDTAYVRAVPDSALRWSYSPEVRDYAEQVEHIVVDNVRIVAQAAPDADPPSLGDTAVYLNDRAELERVVNESYDYVLGTLRGLSEEELLSPAEVFGEEMTTWRAFQLALHHADWTRGQLVPYLRTHGVTPPRWRSY